MLLVDDNKTQALELVCIVKERVRSYQDLRITLQLKMRIFNSCARSQSDSNIQRSKPTPKVIKMLLRENLCRSHQSSLITRLNRVKHSRGRNQSLACSDISLQKSAQRGFSRHVPPYLSDHTNLRGGRRVWKRFEKTFGQTTRPHMALSAQSRDFAPTLFDRDLHRH